MPSVSNTGKIIRTGTPLLPVRNKSELTLEPLAYPPTLIPPYSEPLSKHTSTWIKTPTIQDVLNVLRKGADLTEKPLQCIYNINRYARNSFRAIGGFTQNMGTVQVGSGLGAINVIGVAIYTRNMIEYALQIFAPNRTKEQRVCAVLDFLKASAWAIGDLGIVLGAISLKVALNPGLKFIARNAIYLIVIAFITDVIKNVLDVYFYSQLRKELMEDVKSERNYAAIKYQWEQKINNFHSVIRKLVLISNPEFLKVLNELDTNLQNAGLIENDAPATFAPEAERKGSISFDKKTNENVRYALLGRVNDKLAVKSMDLIANVTDTIAVIAFLAFPPAGFFTISAAIGVSFCTTTALWGVRFSINHISSKKFVTRIGKVASNALNPSAETKPLSEKEIELADMVSNKISKYTLKIPREEAITPESAFLRGMVPMLKKLRKKGYTVEPLSDKHRTGKELILLRLNAIEDAYTSYTVEKTTISPRKLNERGWISTTEWVVVPVKQ